MATEDDLRRMLAGDGGPEAPNRLDAGTVIWRSRARRLPKQLAVGGVSALAVVSVTVLGLQALPLSQSASDSALAPVQEYDEGGAADESELSLKRAPADRLNLCEAPLAEVAPSATGLVLEVAFPATVPPGTERVDGLVIMTNTGTEPVTGTTYTVPAITLSQDGVALWHTNDAYDVVETDVQLAPGESVQFPAWFEPVRCGPEDDALGAFRDDLPPLPAGTYELSAAIDFAPDPPTATTELDLITGPRTPITIE